jgi:hypothetical protein
MKTDSLWSGSILLQRWLRWVGLLVLVTGILFAWRFFPTRKAQDWTDLYSFQFDSVECDALRNVRTVTTWVAPPRLPGSVTIADVANKFRLELSLVCQANDRDLQTCEAETLSPGESSLTLPLYREAQPRRPSRTP